MYWDGVITSTHKQCNIPYLAQRAIFQVYISLLLAISVISKNIYKSLHFLRHDLLQLQDDITASNRSLSRLLVFTVIEDAVNMVRELPGEKPPEKTLLVVISRASFYIEIQAMLTLQLFTGQGQEAADNSL